MNLTESLKEFHDTFLREGDLRYLKWDDLNTPEGRAALSLRLKLIQEEYRELCAELLSMQGDHNNKDKQANVLKEVCDCIYVLVGFMEKLGYDTDEAFKRVHESNMSKTNLEGKAEYREDGKLIKGDNYKPPVLIDLVTLA